MDFAEHLSKIKKQQFGNKFHDNIFLEIVRIIKIKNQKHGNLGNLVY